MAISASRQSLQQAFGGTAWKPAPYADDGDGFTSCVFAAVSDSRVVNSSVRVGLASRLKVLALRSRLCDFFHRHCVRYYSARRSPGSFRGVGVARSAGPRAEADRCRCADAPRCTKGKKSEMMTRLQGPNFWMHATLGFTPASSRVWAQKLALAWTSDKDLPSCAP
jgi:hypothetical protein